MKMLTVIISRDLGHEVEEIISQMKIDCYVQLNEAYGISHACKDTIGENMPWEASVLMIAGEDDTLESLAERIKTQVESHTYKPCLRMMLSSADKVWA